jgi:zinc/manganese transport system permease protein
MRTPRYAPRIETRCMYDLLIAPFIDFEFMRRALAGCVALALSASPVGVFLMLRRMSLTGDAMSHAILPGIALGFLLAGLSVRAMTLGGALAGLVVAFATGAVARSTVLREDASLAGFYLISLALGVLIISTHGSNVDLMRILFGTVLALDDTAVLLLASISTVTLIALAILYRPLVLECVDPHFLRSVSTLSPVAHHGFLVLVVLNLVGAFQALGTLMAVGIMILPATAARFWARDIDAMVLASIGFGFASGGAGLLLSFHTSAPSGPAIVLTAGFFYIASLLFAPHGIVTARFRSRRHLEA